MEIQDSAISTCNEDQVDRWLSYSKILILKTMSNVLRFHSHKIIIQTTFYAELGLTTIYQPLNNDKSREKLNEDILFESFGS